MSNTKHKRNKPKDITSITTRDQPTTGRTKTDPPEEGRRHSEVLIFAPLVLFSRTDCAHCTRVKRDLRRVGVRPTQLYIEELDHWSQHELGRLRRELPHTAQVPALFLSGRPVPVSDLNADYLSAAVRALPSSADIRAVLFDVGGVLVDSPVLELLRYERTLRLPEHFFARVIRATGHAGAFALLERGQLSEAEFCTRFERECATHAATHVAHRGAARLVSGRRFLDCVLSVAANPPRPHYLALVRTLKRMGLLVGVITNNWSLAAPSTGVGTGEPEEALAMDALSQRAMDAMRELRKHFDVVVESYRVRARKPERRIYELATSQLQVRPEECVFLDDLGSNLKAARAYGMHTIQVRPDVPFASILSDLEYYLRTEIPMDEAVAPISSKL